jgi:uncharacterized YccA/Bax inhibitor family protein
MALFRSSNPTLGKLAQLNVDEVTEAATYGGIVMKSAYFVLLTFLAAAISYVFSYPLAETNPDLLVILLVVCAITAFISSFTAILARGTVKIAGSIYAVAEGLIVGFISAVVGLEYGGIVFAALMATFSVFGVMLFLYAKGIIRVGSFFKKFMISALIGAVVINLLMFVASLISPELYTVFYGNGIFSIGISIVMVILASLFILMDLKQMTEIVEAGLDKKYEWVASFSLLITLVWLYLEFLKLFLKFADRK